MPSINWREAMAWPMSSEDRALIEGLRRKEAAGEELTAQESRQAEAIIRVARAGVRGENAERRLKPPQTIDALFAEVDKLP
jgi:hypothetical protein